MCGNGLLSEKKGVIDDFFRINDSFFGNNIGSRHGIFHEGKYESKVGENAFGICRQCYDCSFGVVASYTFNWDDGVGGRHCVDSCVCWCYFCGSVNWQCRNYTFGCFCAGPWNYDSEFSRRGDYLNTSLQIALVPWLSLRWSGIFLLLMFRSSSDKTVSVFS